MQIDSNQGNNQKKNMEIKPEIETFASIKVVGLGGSGGSAIDRMISANIKGVNFIAVNTDAQALHYNKSVQKIHIGKKTTRGLGAGMDPELGKKSAEESKEDIVNAIQGSDMVFLTCGLGGGTGTGSAPVVAEIARDLGALTVAVVTKPFTFEGAQRREIASRGMDDLVSKVDTIITIPNDRLMQVIDKKTSLLDAFAIADDVLKQGIQGISELITVPGLINVDFADVKTIMANAGSALMGIGSGTGENRAIEAAQASIDSPLLDLSIEGAKGILFTVRGGSDLTMHEINEAARVITSSADSSARIIFGAIIDESMQDEIRITVVATGFGRDVNKRVATDSLSIPSKSTKNYAPTSFVREKVAKPEQQVDKFAPRQIPIEEENEEDNRDAFNASENMSREKESQEDLEVPAFLRRKMKRE